MTYIANEFGVTFNAKKTECICFGSLLPRQVYVNGQSIRLKDNVKYLGNVLACDMCDAADIRVKKGEFIGFAPFLHIQFHVVPNGIRIRLLQIIAPLGMVARHGS